MNNKLVLKKITSTDVTTLRALSIKTYTDQFKEQNKPEDFQAYIQIAFNKQLLLEEINNKESSFYFALIDNKPIAYVKLNTGAAQTEIKEINGIELQRIYVDKKFQSKGIGTQLLEKIIHNATREGYTYLWLGVWEHNPYAIKFYKRIGFTAFDKHSFMMGTDRQTDILMKLVL